MSFKAPCRRIPVGDELWTFRADLEASYAFAELTGKGLEDAFPELKPFLRLREIPGEIDALSKALEMADCEDREKKLTALALLRIEYQEHNARRFDPRIWLQLAFALSVDYRYTSGFSSKHHVPADADRSPLDRTEFRAFMKVFDPADLRTEMRDIIFDLYADYITPPGTTETDKETPAISVGGLGAT